MTLFWQNYFGDPWNVLDFVIVVGSIVDIIAAKALVSCLIASLRRVHVPYFVYYMCRAVFLQHEAASIDLRASACPVMLLACRRM